MLGRGGVYLLQILTRYTSTQDLVKSSSSQLQLATQNPSNSHHIDQHPIDTIPFMPPRRHHHLHSPNLLSWEHVPARRSSLHVIEKDLERRRLEKFRYHLRFHDIPYFKKSYKVFVRGPHSRQFFSTSLGSLLSLDYVPRKVKIPTKWVPHKCIHCPCVDNHFDKPPFEYVLEETRTRGRLRRADPDDSSPNDSDTSSD